MSVTTFVCQITFLSVSGSKMGETLQAAFLQKLQYVCSCLSVLVCFTARVCVRADGKECVHVRWHLFLGLVQTNFVAPPGPMTIKVQSNMVRGWIVNTNVLSLCPGTF